MPRYLRLASLSSHIAVEEGDIIHVPGLHTGRIIELVTERDHIALDVPPNNPQGRLTTSISGCGLVMMDEVFLVPRGDGAVDHGDSADLKPKLITLRNERMAAAEAEAGRK